MNRNLVFLILNLILFLVSGCSSGAELPASTLPVQVTPVETAQATPSESGPIPVEELKNATYTGIFDEPVILTDGKFEKSFEGQPYTVEYIDGAELFADLDGDGVEDAVVFLLERGGGTAAFTYVAAQLNRNGQPVDAGAAMVDDRTQVRSATIQDGQVLLDITTRGPGDGDCSSRSADLHLLHKEVGDCL